MKYTIFRLPHCRGDREAWLLSDGGRNIPDGVGDWLPIKSGYSCFEHQSIEDYIMAVGDDSITGSRLNGRNVLGLQPGDIVVMTADDYDSPVITGAWLELSKGRILLAGLFYEEAVAGMKAMRWGR